MKCYKFPLGIEPDYREASRLEALLRRRLKAEAVSLAAGRVSVGSSRPLNRRRLALELSRVLGRDLVSRGRELRDSALSVAQGKVSGASLAAELRGHKIQAVISLGFFAFFEVMKRVSPAAFASTSWLRSLCVLVMSRELLRQGVVEALKDRRPNADTLTITAVLSSVAAGRPESSLTVLALSNFSEMLTHLAAQKARQNISSLVAIDVQEAWVKNEYGLEVRVPIDRIRPGMRVSIHTGEKICVDGSVLEGTAAVDQAAITGESIPVAKHPGDKVFAGTNIRLGDLVIGVEKVGDDTSLARIVHMVEDAQNRRAPIQNYADHMAAALVPVSFIGAAVVYLATRDLQRVLNMLFIDFSCGLKLSTATAMSAAISRAAKAGILVKGGTFIEKASAVDTVVLDKTGTITTGRPAVVRVWLTGDLDENAVLRLAAAAETHSSHPLAVSILEELKARGLEMPGHLRARTVIARGMEAELEGFDGVPGGEVLVGSRKMMDEYGVQGRGAEISLNAESSTPIYVALNRSLVGVLEVCDPIRPEFKRAINRMRFAGVEEVVMLTGDNKRAARAIAAQLGLDDFYAEVLPEDKATYVARKQTGSSVMMVGDGINDAPALAYADVGVAMGSGCTDTAMETADVTINSEDPLKLPEFINIGKKTMHLVHQNFAVTIALNSAAMMLGALGIINPIIASVVHNATTLGVVVNSARVLLPLNKTSSHINQEERAHVQ